MWKEGFVSQPCVVAGSEEMGWADRGGSQQHRAGGAGHDCCT